MGCYANPNPCNVPNPPLKFVPIILRQSVQCKVFGHENSTVNALRSNSSELQDPEQLEEAANVMFDEYWQIVLQDSPEYATVLGDHRYDDRLDTYSLKCYEKKKVMMNEFLERANQLLSISTEGSQIHSDLLLFIINLQSKLDNLMSGSRLRTVWLDTLRPVAKSNCLCSWVAFSVLFRRAVNCIYRSSVDVVARGRPALVDI
ncbi:uncharacterized protein TNCV_4350311 [Trichonephila clavipes]|nr:uncharacterized protein TNCV_4350311 [Trichonephila clavipes]